MVRSETKPCTSAHCPSIPVTVVLTKRTETVEVPPGDHHLLAHALTGDENETCKIPDRLPLPRGAGGCEAEVFHHGRWQMIKAQLVSAKAIDVLRFVGRQPRNDLRRHGIAFIDQGL
jgi:hypothetical protein